MAHFTPVSSLIGGALIGLAAAILWLGIGRIAGISGIVGNLLLPAAKPSREDAAWHIAFLIGLIAAPLLCAWLGGGMQFQIAASPPVIIAAGLLVGIGTRLCGGCTSGHGVCGLARLSPRSLMATAVFMTTAIVTVIVTRHMAGL